MRAILCVLLLSASGCRGEAPPTVASAKSLPDWKSAFEYVIEVEADAIRVRFSVADGFHVYSQGEAVGKPLQLQSAEDSAFLIEGVRYPEGVTKDLPIGRSVIVEGEGRVEATLARREDARDDRVRGVLRYQVCTDEACDRPRTDAFEVEPEPES